MDWQAIKRGNEKAVQKWLQGKKPDVNRCREGELGGTALHWAALHGKMKVAQLLLDTEASMFLQISTVCDEMLYWFPQCIGYNVLFVILQSLMWWTKWVKLPYIGHAKMKRTVMKWWTCCLTSESWSFNEANNILLQIARYKKWFTMHIRYSYN